MYVEHLKCKQAGKRNAHHQREYCYCGFLHVNRCFSTFANFQYCRTILFSFRRQRYMLFASFYTNKGKIQYIYIKRANKLTFVDSLIVKITSIHLAPPRTEMSGVQTGWLVIECVIRLPCSVPRTPSSVAAGCRLEQVRTKRTS